MNFLDNNVSYILGLDNIDINYEVKKEQPVSSLPLWKAKSYGEKAYYEFKILASKRNGDTEVNNIEENYVTYKCSVCDTDVPKLFKKQHIHSDKHKTCLRILEKALERVRQSIVLDIDYNNCKFVQGVYFCDACASVVKLKDREKHEISRTHFKSLMHDKFLQDFLKIYTDKEYIEELQFEYTKCDIDDDNKSGSDSHSDYSVYSEMEEEKSTIKLSVEEYINMLNGRIQGANQLSVEGDMIKITTKDKSVVKVSEANFHGFYELKDYIICGTCEYVISDMDGDMDYHKMTNDHIEKISEPLQDMHCIRAGHASNYCILCNMMVNISLDAHKETQLHTDMLNKARVTDAVKQNDKAPIRSNGASNVTGDKGNLDRSFSSASRFSLDVSPWNTVVNNKNKTKAIPKIRGKTYCEPCKLYIDTHNYNAHAKGKYHQNNIDLEAAIAMHSNLANVVYIDANNFDSHVMGESPKNEVELVNKKPAYNVTVNTAKTYCTPCNIYIDTHNYKGHTKDVAHRNKIGIATKNDLAARDPELSKTFCEVCKVYIHTNNFQAHTEGAKHKNNLRKTTVQGKIPPLINPEQPPLHEHMTTTEVTYTLLCVICSTKIPNVKTNINKHLLGKTHAANLKIFISKLHPHLEYSNNTVSCTLCETPVHMTNIEGHINGELHKNQFRNILNCHQIHNINGVSICAVCLLIIEANKEIEHIDSDMHKQCMTPDGSLYCIICEVKLPGNPQGEAIHKNGRQHKLNLEKKWQTCLAFVQKAVEAMLRSQHL